MATNPGSIRGAWNVASKIPYVMRPRLVLTSADTNIGIEGHRSTAYSGDLMRGESFDGPVGAKWEESYSRNIRT